MATWTRIHRVCTRRFVYQTTAWGHRLVALQVCFSKVLTFIGTRAQINEMLAKGGDTPQGP